MQGSDLDGGDIRAWPASVVKIEAQHILVSAWLAIGEWILHHWNEEECVKQLKRCKEAITINDKRGKVIIIDLMMENQKENEKSTETQLFFDMVMMVLMKEKERTKKEWAKLFLDASFNDYKITPILDLRALIEVYP
ncbi:hypothetical protein ACB098_06G118200 [Castanea mollissima]